MTEKRFTDDGIEGNEGYEIRLRDDGVFILETEKYRFHLDEKTHVEKIARLINENEQLKKQIDNMAFILRQNGLGLMEDDD